MSSTLSDLSNHLAAAVERSSASVVTVYCRPRFPASGVVWRPGLIITADAALRREEELRVTLPDGSTVPASVKGRDPSTDVALLACDTGTAVPAVFKHSEPKPGQIVLTVGRTADTGPIATMGIISGVSGEWQTWRGGKLDEFVRLDVSVYPTSAGGAVVSAEGDVLGMVSAGLSRTSVIAVTRSTIERVAEALAASGHIIRGYLGIGVQPVAIPESLKRQFNIEQDSGVMTLSVEENGPAARAGMLIGDVVLWLGGRRITGPDALHAALDASAVNRPLEAGVLRGGQLLKVAVTAVERPGRGV